MYEMLETVTLRSGERVEAGVITGPDAEWADRIRTLLSHKGRIWQWQNARLLERELPLEGRFYVLHRNGTPFSHIMTGTRRGVGLLGHVWTVPGDRQQGASSALLALLLAHFRDNGGRALLLGTGSPVAERMYARAGFRRIAPHGPCIMAYHAGEPAAFRAEYFDEGEPVAAAVIEPLGWQHWPTSSFLFTEAFPGVVRCAGLGLFGRDLTEGPLLDPLHEAESAPAEQPPRALMLRQAETEAPVGFAMWRADPVWPGTALVDVYCHPRYWERAPELLEELALPPGRAVAYADASLPQQRQTLQGEGFQVLHTLPEWVSQDAPGDERVDVEMLVRG